MVRADSQSDPIDLNPYASKPRLMFKSDGTFKITVFSDLHYGENPWDDWGPQQDVNSTRLMNTVFTSEKPDYVSVWSLCDRRSRRAKAYVQGAQWRPDHRRE